MVEKFPWEAAMAFGFRAMRLTPAEFWAMTPRELAAAMRAFGHGMHAPPGREEMEAMIKSFPDGKDSNHG
ncbi:MAG: rcc01693 family protein [Oricola sp.]